MFLKQLAYLKVLDVAEFVVVDLAVHLFCGILGSVLRGLTPRLVRGLPRVCIHHNGGFMQT